MVRFEKDKLVIEIVAGPSPAEVWMELIGQLSTALYLAGAHPDSVPEGGLWRLSSLIEDLVPEWEDARKMDP